MAALIIVNYDVVDAEGLAGYRALAGPILRGRFGAVGVVGTSDTIDLQEGPGAGTHTVVLQFDTVEAAREAWTSAEYQQVLPLRMAAITPKSAILVETVAPA